MSSIDNRMITTVDKNMLISSYPIGRLYELVRADMEGRINILPVNVGDFVYVLYWTKGKQSYHITESVCSGVHITGDIDMIPYRKTRGKEYIVARYNGFSKHMPMSKLGEVWFLSMEDAKEYAEGVMSSGK